MPVTEHAMLSHTQTAEAQKQAAYLRQRRRMNNRAVLAPIPKERLDSQLLPGITKALLQTHL